MDRSRSTRRGVTVIAIAALVVATVPPAVVSGGTDVPRDRAATATAIEGAAQASPAVVVGNASGHNGSTVTVLVNTSSAPDVAGYELDLRFNGSVARITGVSGTDDFNAPVANVDNDNGTASLAGSKATGTDDPALVAIDFRLIGGGGTATDVTAEFWKLTNSTGSRLENVSVTNGSVGVLNTTVVAGTARGDPGGTVTVPVSVANARNVSGYRANLTFDPGVVRVTDVSGTGDFADPATTIDNTDGWVSFEQSRTGGVTDPELALVTFEIVGEGGQSTGLSFVQSDTGLTDGSGASIPITTRDPGGVAVNASVELGDATASPDANVTLLLSANAGNVAGYEVNFTFDTSVVEVVRFGGTSDFSAPVSKVNNDDGWASIANSRSTGTDNPDLATVTLHVVADNDTTTAVGFAKSKITDPLANRISLAESDPGRVTVQTCPPGDANTDGGVSSGDATLTLRRVVGLPVPPAFDPGCADISQDGGISSGDATLILRVVVGLPI